ncbi:hypothetical protein DPMN_067944 [Dreissena polymorpha]|uniref:Uncharacterized protein n=1 Tax=Dreissena polymorpha TaxID=45954 RepID=A0A9D3Z193_DREPO|nr:hypothetical protein DPMN_067944 [Dreissena polymorpha]
MLKSLLLSLSANSALSSFLQAAQDLDHLKSSVFTADLGVIITNKKDDNSLWSFLYDCWQYVLYVVILLVLFTVIRQGTVLDYVKADPLLLCKEREAVMINDPVASNPKSGLCFDLFWICAAFSCSCSNNSQSLLSKASQS